VTYSANYTPRPSDEWLPGRSEEAQRVAVLIRSVAVPDRLPPRWRALLVACSLAVLCPLFFLTPRGLSPDAGRQVLLVLAVVQAGGMWWMGSRPALVTAVVLCAGAGIQLLYPSVGPGVALVVVSTYAWLRPARASVWTLAVVIALSGVIALVTGRWGGALLWLAAALLAWTWGALGRARSARRQADAARAILEERTRIARELHDVLAHTVSVIVVQAGAARDVFDARPDMARTALDRIDAAARSTLAELRMLLQTMSAVPQPAPGPSDGAQNPGPVGTDASMAPQPGLDQLDALAASLRATGLRVDLDQTPGLAPLPAAVDLSAYRIVQESLTNTLRHSQSGSARVVVRHDPQAVRLEISDDGPARPAGRLAGESGRRGIVGMRERARLLGGTLDAGPRPDGGFAVTAELPLNGVR
jgi:signal transduction histidine kinase